MVFTNSSRGGIDIRQLKRVKRRVIMLKVAISFETRVADGAKNRV